jgi:hypothetical protein
MSTHEEALERDWVTLYVLGELPEPERGRFEEHLFDCPECTEGVKTGHLLLRGVEVTFKRPIVGAEHRAARPVPGRNAPPSRWPRWPRPLIVLPYAAVLCLSLAGAGFEYAALQKASMPQAVVSFAIPPQARGGARQIHLPQTGEFVELDLDLMGPAPQYHWEIRPTGAARALTGGDVRQPADMEALKLLLPIRRLKPGRYDVVITGQPGRDIMYPFEIK